jgi:hypothetical protein
MLPMLPPVAATISVAKDVGSVLQIRTLIPCSVSPSAFTVKLVSKSPACKCVFSVLEVRVRVRVRVRARARVACRSSGAESEPFSVWTGFTMASNW